MISLANWILWGHLLAMGVWLGGATIVLLAILPGTGPEVAAASRRAHFITSRAIELLVLTGVLNILVRSFWGSPAFSGPFFGLISVKTGLLVAMAGLQIWMGLAWKRAGDDLGAAVRRARLGLSAQLVLGAVAVLVGLSLVAT